MGINGLIEISYHDSVTNLQASWGNFSAPFDRAEWFGLLEKTADVDALYAVAKSDSSQVVLPLMRSETALTSLKNWYSFHWQPLLIGPAAPDLLTALCADLRKRAGRLDLAPLSSDGVSTALSEALASTGWLVFEHECDTNHILDLNGQTYVEYHASLPGNLRTTLKRKAKKVAITISTSFESDLWDEYEAIYVDSWKPEEGEPGMLRAFARQEGDAGRIRLAVARHEGQAVAAQFWTVEHGIAYIHKLAHRKDSTKLSPGSSLTAALMEHVIDKDGVQLVDFGTGDDPYKRDWMNAVRHRVRIEAFVASKPSNWPAIGKRMVHNLAKRQTAS